MTIEYACPKVSYVSRSEARSSLKRAINGTDGRHVYKCPRCSSWHVGHRRSKRGRHGRPV